MYTAVQGHFYTTKRAYHIEWYWACQFFLLASIPCYACLTFRNHNQYLCYFADIEGDLFRQDVLL
jgi:hypothetical protein